MALWLLELLLVLVLPSIFPPGTLSMFSYSSFLWWWWWFIPTISGSFVSLGPPWQRRKKRRRWRWRWRGVEGKKRSGDGVRDIHGKDMRTLLMATAVPNHIGKVHLPPPFRCGRVRFLLWNRWWCCCCIGSVHFHQGAPMWFTPLNCPVRLFHFFSLLLLAG